MNKYVIMGVQGCGKGTQAKKLVEDFGLVHISVGDMFRWNIHNHTKLAARVSQIVSSGQLVPDELVQELVKDRLDQHDWNHGFILDGFPRNAAQAGFFLASYDVDAVLVIEVPDEVVFDRIINRRLCSSCGRDYNLKHQPPKMPDTCDTCWGQLVQRPDDQPEAIRERLNDYHTQTQPVIELFRGKERIVVADGTKPPDEVQASLREQLGLVAAPSVASS